MVTLFVEQISDYRSLTSLVIEADVTPTTDSNFGQFLDMLEAHTSMEPGEWVRRGAARRFHQNISLEALLHSYRIWGRCIWGAVIDTIGEAEPERSLLPDIAAVLMDQVNTLSNEAARAYKEESLRHLTAPDVLPGEVIEGLLTGGAQSPSWVQRELTRLDRLGVDQLLVLTVGLHVNETAVDLQSILDDIREFLRVACPELLLGAWQNQVFVFCPIRSPESIDELTVACKQVAEARPLWVCIASDILQNWQDVPDIHAELTQGFALARRYGWCGRLMRLSDILLDQIVTDTPYAKALLRQSIDPLVAVEGAKSGLLLDSLRAYITCQYNATAAARSLFVTPNTLTYRLKRIEQLTGRDLSDVSDLVLLTLGLRLHDLTQKAAVVPVAFASLEP
ncbi:helix-turn-helix domain-containing protein [Microbacterium aquimaris]|uniref:PucR family transcriptional regulator n=1 Tax=Microbacterium aquimaris TaxID=459816 RepID=UPI002AD45493|nr:helix-turn-helix domain-containing protein [Microbacterium aquimaris]MDZ8274828.1 helix-turn-helix domain-containing protein [Microbacterium aquimaris]